ncbi:alpha/beta hydrolase [Microbacterium lushaniae]|uniref:Alpha/beta hydrolase n=1 Tax=Microbacterium lushaniae TaxID=2614639 RepID=A0A5J6L704_9MICO|nr:alpha/beta hydrolase [Microbacterium lushaniae]QEW04247.1 alpha/beta hydrolase [Microbacterium lushaniae]
MSSPPPFDPEIVAALQARTDVVTTLRADEIARLRAGITRPTDAEITLGGVFDFSEHSVPSVDGRTLPMVMLRPRNAETPVPVLYHVHGGGLVVGTPYEDLPSLAALARDVGCAVASIDYRLAPEHPYPVPLEDVYSGLTWLVAEATSLGIDPRRVILSGVSAGGGLAAAAALLGRDRGGPVVRGQLLACPMLDDRNDTPSAHQMAGIGAWDRTANETGWTAYLGAERGDVPAYASPGRVTDLSGLPPMFLDVGSAETFRDEVVAYAARVWECGGEAELHVWPGGAHGFDTLAPDAALSRAARAARAGWLRRRLGAPAPAPRSG